MRHGKSKTRTYHSWPGMLSRCENPKDRKFAIYGGRGITVCERWHRFELFLADMGEAPDGLTLDRLDNNKGYEPSNCTWRSLTDQSRNRRNNRLLTFDGRTQCIGTWAVEVGLAAATLNKRLTLGWEPKLALTTPPRKGTTSGHKSVYRHRNKWRVHFNVRDKDGKSFRKEIGTFNTVEEALTAYHAAKREAL